MNRLLTFFFLLLTFGCTTENQPSNTINEAVYNEFKIDEFKVIEELKIIDKLEPYNIKFQIGKAENINEYNLFVNMELDSRSYFISPFSSDGFTGRFNISIEDNPHLAIDSAFTETPRSVEKFDPHPFINGLVNWVMVNTSYKYQLNLLSQDDFEVAGLVSFTIEPRCTFEEIEFNISHHSGELKIRKI